jgi:hypothetical protein
MKKIKLLIMSVMMLTALTRISSAQCNIPIGLSTTSINATTTSLNWTPTSGALQYNIEIQNASGNPIAYLSKVNSIVNNYIIDSLTPGSAYKFKVRTRCINGKSNWSPYSIFVAGGGAINCNLITGITTSNITANSATFNWNASVGGLGYALKVEDATGNPIDFVFTVNTINNSYTINGLNPLSNYKVKIRKRCAPGVNSNWSPWVNFSTTNLLLANETNRVASNINSKEIQLFPNPASDIININFNAIDDENISKIQITDINGRIIQSNIENNENPNNKLSIPVQDLNSGIYFLTVFTSERSMISKFSIVR